MAVADLCLQACFCMSVSIQKPVLPRHLDDQRLQTSVYLLFPWAEAGKRETQTQSLAGSLCHLGVQVCQAISREQNLAGVNSAAPLRLMNTSEIPPKAKMA